jgi:hypothetical protein
MVTRGPGIAIFRFNASFKDDLIWKANANVLLWQLRAVFGFAFSSILGGET